MPRKPEYNYQLTEWLETEEECYELCDCLEKYRTDFAIKPIPKRNKKSKYYKQHRYAVFVKFTPRKVICSRPSNDSK